jgi:hypothetical protein
MHFGKLGFALILFPGRSTSTITLSSKNSINDEKTPFTGTGLDEAKEEREPIFRQILGSSLCKSVDNGKFTKR